MGSRSGLNPDFVDKAYTWCRQYLRGPWARVEKHEFNVENFAGAGLSNYLYICSIPANKTQTGPNKVLLRIHGEILDDSSIALTESIVFSLLAERKIAPKLYGIFQGGRIEEYIPSRSLTVEEMGYESYNIEIAQKLAGFHGMDLPLSKEPTWVINMCHRWLHEVLHSISFTTPELDTKYNKLLSYGLPEELKYLEKMIEVTSSPTVFCHNDLNEGNILLVNSDSKCNRLMFIDFEYAGYNHRGFDIANHFCEWTFDYTTTTPPYYKYDPENYPNKEQQLRFIRAYLNSFDNAMNDLESRETEEVKMLTEIKRFSMLSHFFWVLWAIIQGKKSQHKFCHLDYAQTRIEAYFEVKNQITL
ncbi:choline/ethanolamine kinase-like [Saccoglossus kowalevskii]|uniref:Choline/ethanolamine kinase-like n=1 Tax=Saccoglossus kowalevskii TaxID=10224 RepID=A0ABM0M7Q4_SACKO|nr:PREDICTED: choline/ethanolamine kinase-like [Saccoglossus kowalevskii]